MDRKQKILNAIKQDGENAAANVLDKAKMEAKANETQARIRANNLIKERADAVETKCQEVFLNAKELSVMDQSMQVLAAKNRVVNKVFGEVIKDIKSLPRTKYEKFILALIEKHAEDGDVVTVSKEDKIEDVLKKADVYKKLHLKIQVAEDFVGGVILENEYCVKDLTIENIVAEKRRELIVSLSKKLF